MAGVFDFKYDDLPDYPDEEEPKKLEHDFKGGDRVYVKGIDHSDAEYGAEVDMIAMVGQVYKIVQVDPYDGACILGPQEYAFHHKDLLSEKDMKKKGIKPPKKEEYREIPAPDWFKAYGNGALSGGCCSIYYLLYRPKKGEVAKRPTYKTLAKRATEQERKKYIKDPNGWNSRVDLTPEELKKKGSYTCWESSNHACFAKLKNQPPRFKSPQYWNGKPPSWMFYRIDSQVVNGRGRLLKWEVQAYIELLMEYGLAPPDIRIKQLLEEDAVTFRLKDYGNNHLFGMLNAMRYVHEYPIVARQTLYFMQNGFNFYIAFVLAHKFGGRSHGSHSLLSTYQWTNWEILPHKILEMAWRVEKYFLKEAKKEQAFVKRTEGKMYNIQSTISAVPIKAVPVVESWEALGTQEPLYYKPSTKKR